MVSPIFLLDTVKAASLSELQDSKKETSVEEPEVEVEVENVERPVDLYKAIFSDDSEDDEDQHKSGLCKGVFKINHGLIQTSHKRREYYKRRTRL